MKDMKIFRTRIVTDLHDSIHRGLSSRFKVPALAGTSRGAFNMGSSGPFAYPLIDVSSVYYAENPDLLDYYLIDHAKVPDTEFPETL